MMHIEWHMPIPVTAGVHSGLGCRICIAEYGLTAEQVKLLPKTYEEFRHHMRDQHGINLKKETVQ